MFENKGEQMQQFRNTLVGMISAIVDRARREEGQALVEYALILSLIAVVAIVSLQATGTNITSLLNNVAQDL